LQGQDQVVVPTDETNSFHLVDSQDYIRWVKGHLDASAKVVSRHHLMDILESGKELLDDLEGLMGKKEYKFVKQSLLSRKIPTPSLLIKDHKKASSTGEFPTRLVVPAQNFTSAFPKLGYIAVHQILDSNHVDYSKRTIIQASNLKEKLKSLHIC
jgi:hypothetical protein